MTRKEFSIGALSVFVAACTAGSNPAVDLAAEAEAIRAQGESMLAADNARDFATSLTFYAPDAVIQAPNMPTVNGQAAIRDMYAQPKAPGAPEVQGAFANRAVTVAASGDLAWEWRTARSTVAAPEGAMVLTSKQLIVWKKVDNSWLIAAMSWSSDGPR